MDERAFEMAEKRAEDERQAAIDSRVRYQGVSAHFCEDCDGTIPDARRVALPGVQTCVDCQGIREVQGVRRG